LIGPDHAEGIAVKAPGKLTMPIVRALGRTSTGWPQSDRTRHLAALRPLEIEKTLVEAPPAAAYAAWSPTEICSRAARSASCCRAAISTCAAVERHPARDCRAGRIMSLVIRSWICRHPGRGSRRLIGEAGGNILEVSHTRMMTDTSAKVPISA